MAVLSTDLKIYLSGGSANSDPLLSLGGARSSTAVTLSTLFDTVSGAESTAGDIEYRCVYVRNEAAQTLYSAVVWLSANASNPGVAMAIGLGTSALSGTEQTVGGEGTAPSGVSFTAPSTKATGLSIGDMASDAFKAVWLRRTVGAGTSADNSDTATLSMGGDTAE